MDRVKSSEELFLIIVVDFQQLDSLLLKAGLVTVLTYSGPYLVARFEGLADEMAADEARGSGDE